MSRDEFTAPVKESLAKRAAFICSNPDCRVMTVGPALASEDKVVYVGKAAHIRGAAKGGPRYDGKQTEAARSSISNGIFLCAFCADMVDRNGGADHSIELLERWKSDHETWVRENLNKHAASELSVVDGAHAASGKGEVIGLDLEGPVFIQPGTRSSASGEGTVIGTRIGQRRKE